MLYPFPLLLHVPVVWDLVLFAPLGQADLFWGVLARGDFAEGVGWAGSESRDWVEAVAHCPPCCLVMCCQAQCCNIHDAISFKSQKDSPQRFYLGEASPLCTMDIVSLAFCSPLRAQQLLALPRGLAPFRVVSWLRHLCGQYPSLT